MIHPNALQDFYGITNHLTIEEIAKEVEDYINLNFAIYDRHHFAEVQTEFINEIYKQDATE